MPLRGWGFDGSQGPKQPDRRSPSQKLRQARRASLIKYAPSSLGHTLLEEAMSGGRLARTGACRVLHQSAWSWAIEIIKSVP